MHGETVKLMNHSLMRLRSFKTCFINLVRNLKNSMWCISSDERSFSLLLLRITQLYFLCTDR